MTVLCWILGILLALFVLLCLTRIGGTVYLGDTISFDVKAGLLRFHFDPMAPKKPAKPKSEKKPTKPKKEITAADLKAKLPKVTLADVKEMYRTLWPIARRALNRTRRGIRLKPFRLSIYLAGGDPADLAQLYGYVNAAIWTLMPQLERLLVIPDPSIHTELSFEAERTRIRGEIGLDVRVGTLLWVGVEAGIPTLRWFLRFQKTHKPPAPPSAQPPETAKTSDANTAA